MTALKHSANVAPPLGQPALWGIGTMIVATTLVWLLASLFSATALWGIEFAGEAGGAAQQLRLGKVRGQFWAVGIVGTCLALVCALVVWRVVIRMRRDMLQLAAAEASLREGERRHRAMLECVPDLMFVIDREGVYRDCHAGNHSELLLPADQFLGRPMGELLPPALAETSWRALQEVFATGRTVCFDYEVMLDGQPRWYEARLVPMDDDRAMILSRDFSAQRRAEVELRRSEARFRALYDGSRDAVMMLDDNGLFDCNAATLEMFGLDSIETFRELQVADLSPPQQPDGRCSQSAARAHITEALRVGSARFEWLHRRWDDGQPFHTEVLLSAQEIDGRRVLQGVVRDITERVQARERLVSIYQAVAEGIVLMDAEGTIVDCNPAAERILGLDRDQVLGRTPRDPRWRAVREDGSDFPGEEHPASVTLRTGEAVRSLVHGIHLPGGEQRWISVSTEAVRGQDGAVSGVVASMADVTELRAHSLALAASEAALRKTALQAQAASQAKSEFLANMSHEIRTPMTAILGYADLLAEEPKGTLDGQQVEEAVSAIRGNARHLLTVLNDILDMSKIEAGQLAVERIPTDPAALLDEVLGLVEPAAMRKGLTLELMRDSELPECIVTDPTRLRQILLNLLGNAVKFTEHGGVRLHAACDEQGATLLLSVVDTGIGLTGQQLATLSRFEAFTQADSSVTRRFGGSGLGLRISNALAGLLGGRLEIASTVGVGSRFTVTVATGLDQGQVPETTAGDLPDARPGASQPPGDQAARPLAGVIILLAEDSADNRRLLAFHLQRAGAEVRVAKDGFEALEAVEREHPDLVLMDMQMPRMDGYEATRRLQGLAPALPVIALTAHAMSGDRERCLAAGCDGYLTKPIAASRLVEACRRQLDRAARAAEALQG